MQLTTVQQVYQEFRTCDDYLDSEENFADLDLVEGSCFAMDDDRTFSNSSDFSDITYANLPSNTSHTTSPRSDDGRSFSNISNISQDTFESLILSDTSVTTLIDEIEDSLLESSDSFSEDHVSSMVALLKESPDTVSVLPSIPTKVRFTALVRATNPCKSQPKATSPKTSATAKGINKASSEKLKQGSLVSSYKIQRFDVLSGRGGKSNHHIGNKVFRHLVTELKPAYRATVRKIEKARLAESLIEKVHQMGGRFLIQNQEPWEPQWRFMTKKEAQRKTSQALRETRKHQWTHGSHFASPQFSS